jgi:hypothetical protein
MIKKLKDNQTEEIVKIKRVQANMHKKFESCTNNQDVAAEYTLAQAKEICDYFMKLIIIPFQGWEGFLRESINRDKESFLYRFYLIQNEYGMFEPDMERIDRLRIK